jgi:hypothetical protein
MIRIKKDSISSRELGPPKAKRRRALMNTPNSKQNIIPSPSLTGERVAVRGNSLPKKIE